MKFENYRSELASDLKEMRKTEGGREKAKSILEQEKKTIRYTETKDLHLINDVLPKFEAVDYEDEEQTLEKLNAKTLYESKVSLLNEVFMEQYEEEIEKKTSSILTQVGLRNAESVTIWESVKNQLLDAVTAESEGIDQDSMMGIRFIDKDDPTSSIEKFSSENHEHLGLEEIKGLQEWLRNNISGGEYQLYHYGSSSMFEDVVLSNKLLSKHLEEYDPESFGITKKTIDRLIIGIACIRADFRSKPNYPYARRDMVGFASSMHSLLSSVVRIRSQEFLKTHDIDLPTD